MEQSCAKGTGRIPNICSSPESKKREIETLLNIYEDNGHSKDRLRPIINSYDPQTAGKNKEKNGTKKQMNNESYETVLLFRQLPFDENDDDLPPADAKPFICIPYVPGIANKLRRIGQKAGCHITFKSGPKLKDILCAKNKSRPPKTELKGCYRYQCPCSPSKKYVGQSRRKISTRGKEHESAVIKNWSHSGITAHKEHCDAPIDWDNPDVLVTMQNRNKRALQYDLRVTEALEIRRNNCGLGKGLNEDMGDM